MLHVPHFTCQLHLRHFSLESNAKLFKIHGFQNTLLKNHGFFGIGIYLTYSNKRTTRISIAGIRISFFSCGTNLCSLQVSIGFSMKFPLTQLIFNEIFTQLLQMVRASFFCCSSPSSRNKIFPC